MLASISKMNQINQLVQYKTVILMFHLFLGTLPIHLQKGFTIYSTTRSTRRIDTYVMLQARTNITSMCLSVDCVKLWNSLGNNLMDCSSVIIFKKKLKKYFNSTRRVQCHYPPVLLHRCLRLSLPM